MATERMDEGAIVIITTIVAASVVVLTLIGTVFTNTMNERAVLADVARKGGDPVLLVCAKEATSSAISPTCSAYLASH